MRKEEQGIQEKVMQSRSLKSRSNFTAVPNELIKCYDLSRAAKMLWIELFSYSYNGSDIFPGITRMAKNLNVSRSTIMRDRKELEEKGLVVVERKGFTKTNMYILHDPSELGLPNGSNSDVANMEHHDVASVEHHDVAQMTHKEDRAVKKTKNKKTKYMSPSKLNNKKISKQPISKTSIKVIEYLNTTAKKNYKHSKYIDKLIEEVLNTGATLSDILLLIDFKCNRWINDVKMDEFLRPKTLFSAKNFDEYLQGAVSWDKGGRKTKGVVSFYKGTNNSDDYNALIE